MSRMERTLGDLARAVDWPEPSPHLASRVTARVATGPRPRRPSRWAIVAGLVTLVLVIAVVPDSRQSVADVLEEAGIRIGFVEPTPGVTGEDLDLGEAVTVDGAARRARFGLSLPTALGPPEEVYVDGEVVSMLWDGPLLLTQRPGDEPYAQKGLGPETEALGVNVAGEPGLWIEGAEHTFTLLDSEGNLIEESSRLAANVLLWSSDGVDYRLELTQSLDEAEEIAGSMERMK